MPPAPNNGCEDADQPLPERRGYLLNEYTGGREYFVLRGGVLRVRQSPRGADTGSVYLAHGSSVTLLANNVLEVRSKVPFVQEFVLAAPSEAEAEGWHDALKASIRLQAAKMEKLQALLENGCTMHKYNYSNSKRSRRYFRVAEDGRELRWGRTRGETQGDDPQKVNLYECIGIIYGPMTTTFQRCAAIEDPAWNCFSLLFMGRTLDLTVAGDLQVHAWFLGMQHLISRHGVGSMPIMSEAQFTVRKVQYKIQAVAHRQGLVFSRYFITRLRALAAGKILPSAPVSNGSAPQLTAFTAQGLNGHGHDIVRKGIGSNGKETKQTEAVTSSLRPRLAKLQALVREREVQADAAEVLLKKLAGSSLPSGAERPVAVQKALQSATLEALHARCRGLDADVQRLTSATEQMAAQAKPAERPEKSLRKLQQKLDESEARRSALEAELRGVRAKTEAASGAKTSSSTAEAEAKSRGVQLETQVKELERQLLEVQAKQKTDTAAARNQQQAEAIAQAEQEKLAAVQKLETLQREVARVKEAEQKSLEQLRRSEALHRKLDSAVAPLRQAAARLCEAQRCLRTEVKGAGGTFEDTIRKVAAVCSQLGERSRALEVKYKEGMDERKKLHNLVLDLKGNIRVFVRVRPINAKETQHEPPGQATIDYKEDAPHIGVYDGGHQRLKWFEFDQVFSPNTTQLQVFEEAKPLATSVLDGFNVCIFAYGQTGSGKTHTMSGTQQDPGMNTRVLKELFRIRNERQGEYVIGIAMSVSEIYNEEIRDLLKPSSKKLEVKQNPDGTCGIPGLSDQLVQNVEDVLRCIQDAQKNRSTSTTDMNEQSSRSHSIVTVRTNCTLKGGGTYIGKIHLIDLAGSENTNKSGVSGQGMKEAQNINKSLSALGDVIQSLVAKSTHTPYRNSKLTMMLKDSLGGDSKTLMIVCASPAQFNVSETLSSLNFAARARNVELGKAKRNVAS